MSDLTLQDVLTTKAQNNRDNSKSTGLKNVLDYTQTSDFNYIFNHLKVPLLIDAYTSYQ